MPRDGEEPRFKFRFAVVLVAAFEHADPSFLEKILRARYVTGDKARAEDFFQETWIRVLERGHQYDGKSKFEAWLFAIARHLRSEERRVGKVATASVARECLEE